MAKKVSTKSTTVDYIIDLTGVECGADVYLAFAAAKMDKALSQTELDVFVDTFTPKFYIMPGALTCCQCECAKPKKKPNIFKRAWNWLTGK